MSRCCSCVVRGGGYGGVGASSLRRWCVFGAKTSLARFLLLYGCLTFADVAFARSAFLFVANMATFQK